MAPQNSPSIIRIPPLPFKVSVNGSIIDSPITEDNPGMTPTKIPNSVPAAI